jgi:two-component sensor histidine kinase
MNLALAYLNHNQPVAEIPLNCSAVLKPMVEQVNRLIRAQDNLRQMRGQLVEQISEAAAQEERNRLARDLHDSIKQQVFIMSISAAAAYAHLEGNPAAARAALADVKTSAQEAMVEMRALLQQLSPAPLEKSGLIQALRDQCEALAYRTGATVTPSVSQPLPPDDHLPTGAQEAIFRIAQEALSNIARHARAQTVHLSLSHAPNAPVTLTIRDDGQGFDPATVAHGMGLNNMHSRATAIGAEVSLTSAPSAGTTLTLTIPLVQPHLPLEEPDPMAEHYRDRLPQFITQYVLFAGGLITSLFSVSLLAWRVIQRPETLSEDQFLMGILSVFALVGVPVAVWAVEELRRQAAPLRLRFAPDHPLTLRLRRHAHMSYLSIGLLAAWFLPMVVIDGSAGNLAPLGVALPFMLGVVWNYRQMATLYFREFQQLRPDQRAGELAQRLSELRSGWPSLVFLLFMMAITGTFSGDMRLPPENTDHWMNTAFLTVSGLLLINQVVSWLTYRRWRLANAAQEVAQ